MVRAKGYVLLLKHEHDRFLPFTKPFWTKRGARLYGQEFARQAWRVNHEVIGWEVRNRSKKVVASSRLELDRKLEEVRTWSA